MKCLWGSAPTSPVNVCIVGFGNAGALMHAPAFDGLASYHVVAVVDPSDERRALAEQRDPPYPAFESLSDALSSAEIDVVDVCAPPNFHVAAVTEALSNGCHVTCEKPLSSNLDDARAMVRDVNIDRVRMVHNYLLRPEVEGALEVVRKGVVGAVRCIEVSLMGVLDLPGVSQWRPSWRHDADVSGGGVLADMSHVIYIICAIIGPIEEVVACGDPGRSETEIYVLLRGGKATVTLAVAWGMGGGHLKITGDCGRVEVLLEAGGTLPFAKCDGLRVFRDGEAVPFRVRTGHGVDELFHAEFFEALLNPDVPFAEAKWGLHVLEVLDAIYRSVHCGAWIAVS